MNNHNDNPELEALAAWSVETTDLAGRVRAALGATTPVEELLAELRAVRQELGELRLSNAVLQDELARLRVELVGRTVTRIAPYAPTEGLIRLA